MRKIKASIADNGIGLHSKRDKTLVALATFDENENFKTEWTIVQEYEVVRNIQEKILDFLISIFSILLLIISILLIFMRFGSSSYTIYFSYIVYVVILFLVHIITTILEKLLHKDRQKFRAATNMLLNAYKELHRVPSIGEIRNFPMFKSYGCFNFWQRLKIIEPTDRELMVAIACMETYIANE